MTALVWARIDTGGFHSWPDAPEKYRHLRERHWHLFRLIVEASVTELDREVPFEELRELLWEHWPGPELGELSCEHVAFEMETAISDELGVPVRMTVSEDGNAGATYGDV